MIGLSVAILPRIGLILTFLYFWPNSYALMATQILDGIGAGVNGLAIMKVTKTLTEGTNHFGLYFGIVNTFFLVGASTSNVIAGYIADAFGYKVAFTFLLLPAFFCMVCMYFTSVRSPEEEETKMRKYGREYVEIEEQK